MQVTPDLFKNAVVYFLDVGGTKPYRPPAGWIAHYAIECSLAAVFYRSWKLARAKPKMFYALAYGWGSGLAAILWWHTAFQLHPRPPRLARRNFYLHMLVAYLVYSVSVAGACRPTMKLIEI